MPSCDSAEARRTGEVCEGGRKKVTEEGVKELVTAWRARHNVWAGGTRRQEKVHIRAGAERTFGDYVGIWDLFRGFPHKMPSVVE